MIQEYNLKNFNKNGVAWPYKLAKNYDAQELKEKFFKFKDTSLKVFSNELSLKPHLLSNFFYKLAIDKNILKCVKEIIGENVYIWSSAFFSKAPGEGKVVSFHQDNPYWQLTTQKVITAWIALTSSDLNSGALQVVPKSHKLGLIKKLDVENPRKSYLEGIKTTATNDLLSFNQNLGDFIKKNAPLTLYLSPGEFSIHHVNTVHGSGINKSSDYRIGFAVRYISSETQHLEEQKDFATHIMGKKNKYYVDEIPPTEDFDEKALNQYQISMNSTGVFGNKKY